MPSNMYFNQHILRLIEQNPKIQTTKLCLKAYPDIDTTEWHKTIIGESVFHEYERDIMAPHMDVYLFRFLEQEHYSLWENVSDAVDQLIEQQLVSFDSSTGALEVI